VLAQDPTVGAAKCLHFLALLLLSPYIKAARTVGTDKNEQITSLLTYYKAPYKLTFSKAPPTSRSAQKEISSVHKRIVHNSTQVLLPTVQQYGNFVDHEDGPFMGSVNWRP